MHQTLFKITKIYQVEDRDWMNYKVTPKNNLTYHHIKEKRNGGSKTIDNGAPLTEIAHQYLNIIESKDKRLYIALNTMFELINKNSKPITMEQRMIIEEILTYFENNIDNYKLKKPLNKEYKIRRL